MIYYTTQDVSFIEDKIWYFNLHEFFIELKCVTIKY